MIFLHAELKVRGECNDLPETLRILFVSDLYEPHIGGLSTHQRNLARELVKKGHTVRVVTSEIPGTNAWESIDGVEVQRVKSFVVNPRLSFGVTSIATVASSLRGFDLAQGPTFVAALPLGLTTRLSGKPGVLTVLEVFGEAWRKFHSLSPMKSIAYRRTERTLLRLGFSRYVAISEHTRGALIALGIESRRCDTIYPGVDYGFWKADRADPESFRANNQLGDRFLYMSYGRAGLSKGIEYLLEAAEMVANEVPSSRLLLVLNAGELYGMLTRRIAQSRLLREHVILRSRLSDVELRDAVVAADCVVVPSQSEGFGYTVAEACAVGTPVIASNAASIPEVISGRHLLVPPRNPRAIAEAILRGRVGDWMVAPAKRFTWEAATAAYETCFRGAISDCGMRR